MLGVRSIGLTFDPPGRVSVVDSAEVNGALHPRQSLHREVRFSAPLSASEDTANNEWGAVTGALLRFQTSKNLLSDSHIEVRVDSTFAGYSLAPLRDGITDTTGLDWSESAWASSDISVPHWIEARWKSPTPIRRVAIYWAEDGGAYLRSENYRLQYRADGAWVDWPEIDSESTATVDTYRAASPVTTDGIRLWQEVGGGHADRPNLLWLRELDIR